MAEQYALPLTFLFIREGKQWTGLACEIDVASCGDSLEEAREMAKDAVQAYVTVMVEEDRVDDLSRPVPAADLAEIFNMPPEDLVTEYHTLLFSVEGEQELRVAAMSFLRSMVAPTCCHPKVAA